MQFDWIPPVEKEEQEEVLSPVIMKTEEEALPAAEEVSSAGPEQAPKKKESAAKENKEAGKEKTPQAAPQKNGWKKELNLVSWNGREPVYDIRTWSPDGSKMGKGVTISKEEMENLKELLKGM